MKKILVLLLLCLSTSCFAYDPALREKVVKEFIYKAQQGSIKAHEDLAFFYFHVKKYKDGAYWAQKGASLGSPKCMYMIGMAYVLGNGVEMDVCTGIDYLEKSKKLGNKDADRFLQKMNNDIRNHTTTSVYKDIRRAL